MMKAAAAVVLLSACASALAQSSIYDSRTGRSWEAQPSQESDRYAPRSYEPKTYEPPRQERYDVFSRDGQKIDSGKVDGDGRVWSERTGRPIGTLRR